MAKPAISAPSISLCGSWRMISRSLHDPGSDSSALITRKLGLPGLGSLGMKLHFMPVAQPRRLDVLDDLVLPARHQRLGVVPVAALAGGIEVPRLETVEIGEDAILV